MKIKEVKLLEFSELNQEQKNKVLDKYRDINTKFDWWDAVYSDYIGKGSEFGLTFDDIKQPFYWSGFYSQGDGACISKASLDILSFLVFLKKDNPTSFNDIKPIYSYLVRNKDITCRCNIRQFGHYYHSRSMMTGFDMDRELEQHPKLGKLFDELEDVINNFISDYCNNLYYDLKHNYEALQEDVAVQETLKMNEYLFNEITLAIEC